MIFENPFLSQSFKSIWLKHFNSNNDSIKSFDCISNVEFLKHNNWPIHVNVGETLTKGMDYALALNNKSCLNGETLLIYDVPTYFNVNSSNLGPNIGLLKSKQYPGFLIETGNYSSLDDYMQHNFSKSSRNKNRKYKRRLETAFNIKYKMWCGEITKSEHDSIFKHFKRLLIKRFDDKQITNDVLGSEKWAFYHDVSYSLILEKKASLFVIYDNDQPIGVTLCFFSEDILFDAVTVFDIDYFKFHLGAVTIMKLIEWCIDNGIKTFDFSKGYYEYKTRWCTKTYDFEYHIFYDTSSLKSKFIAKWVKHFYDVKQKLRDKKLNDRLHKVTYRIKHKEQKEESEKAKYSFIDCEDVKALGKFIAIDYEKSENQALRLMLFEYLYLYEENYNDLKIFKYQDQNKKYLITGSKTSVIASIND
ncbi:GNAT family N-acetyltransferase [Winogradskyella sp. SYSU M77433]|uniref:GNAT family N-acetyltransferase n=1 Tax=Winogradskyella sp. SYSU M77433 TaxID=3042722 RepID=UPI002480F15D|nr:GNAT family N-acetyltransferase [Winogradskyella sp. SYSU M77433]